MASLIDNPKSLPLTALLTRIDQEVCRLGPREYSAAENLLAEFQHATNAELRAALTSLLARDNAEWASISAIFDEFFSTSDFATESYGQARNHALKATIGFEAADRKMGLILRTRNAVVYAFRQLLQIVFDAPRVILLVAMMMFVIGLMLQFSVVAPNANEPDISGESSGVTTPPDPNLSAKLLSLVAQKEIQSAAPSAPLSTVLQALIAGLAALVFLFGHRLLQVAGLPPGRLQQQAKETQRDSDHKREKLEEELASTGQRMSIEYHVPQPVPVPVAAIADSATLLGRLYRSEPGRRLAAKPTIAKSLAAGGQFTPVMANSDRRHTVLLLIDVERGDHPWLGGFNRIVALWKQQGVRLLILHFSMTPQQVRDPKTGQPIELHLLARQTEGMPLLIFSRALIADSMSQSHAGWLSVLKAWPLNAWIDPDPFPLEQRPRHRQHEIQTLLSTGLKRFPLTGEGLTTAAIWLASNGQTQPPRFTNCGLSEVTDPSRVEVALRLWGLAACLVPDPGWDQLDAIRCEFPEIHRVFARQQDVAQLRQWTAQQVDDPEARGGSVLNIPAELQDKWLSEYLQHVKKGTLHYPADFEKRARQLLLKQLGNTPPENTLLREWWLFKRKMHQSILQPNRALELLSDIENSPIAREALKWIEAERKRSEKNTNRWGNATTETMRRVQGIAEGVALRELFLRDMKLWLPAIGTMGIVLPALAAITWLGANLITPQLEKRTAVRPTLLPPTYYLSLDPTENQPALADWVPQMVALSGGEFSMGSGDTHHVTLQSFEISKTEVTVRQYAECVIQKGGCKEPETDGAYCSWPGTERVRELLEGQKVAQDELSVLKLPVNCVSWEDANRYAEFVSSVLPDVRLPTEAEWEYAASDSGKEQEYPWGDAVPSCSLANTSDCVDSEPLPVCSKPAGNTSAGLCDMSGNVWEWVQDDWHNTYDAAPKDGTAWIDDPRGVSRVIRGGSFGIDPRSARVASRGWAQPSRRFDDLGFRLSRSLSSSL